MTTIEKKKFSLEDFWRGVAQCQEVHPDLKLGEAAWWCLGYDRVDLADLLTLSRHLSNGKLEKHPAALILPVESETEPVFVAFKEFLKENWDKK